MQQPLSSTSSNAVETLNASLPDLRLFTWSTLYNIVLRAAAVEPTPPHPPPIPSIFTHQPTSSRCTVNSVIETIMFTTYAINRRCSYHHIALTIRLHNIIACLPIKSIEGGERVRVIHSPHVSASQYANHVG